MSSRTVLARKTAAALLALVFSVLVARLGLAETCGKKGIGLGQRVGTMTADDLLHKMGASWYYHWGLRLKTDPTDVAFIPMVPAKQPRRESDLATLANGPKASVLLAINEPDVSSQANMSVDDAVALWPRLQGLAKRISSPAISSFLHPSWIERFMSRAAELRLKVDFIAIHYYGPPDAQAFLRQLDYLHATYHLPIWMTEMAVRDQNWQQGGNHYSVDDVLNFMKVVLPEMERRSYVERFAWWGVGGKDAEAVRTSQFFAPDGTLTPVGSYYASFDRAAANASDPTRCGGGL